VSKSQQVTRVQSWIVRWSLPIVWAILPLTAGPAFADALDPRSPAFRTTVSIALWGIWAITLVLTLVPRTTSLTGVRIVVPASFAAAVWSSFATPEPDWQDGLALATTALAAALALAASTSERFVNGSSYGAERRMPLRPPGLVVLGLVEAVWAAVVVGAAAGPLLLASKQWIAGAVALVVGWPLAVMGTRSLHRLAQRWFVFVPNGVVLVDPLALTDSCSMTRAAVESIGPAPADTSAHDLTVGALGLALEIDLVAPQEVALLEAGRTGPPPTISVDQVLFTPSRPGALLREARARGLPVR
jgi:hypothetical protein